MNDIYYMKEALKEAKKAYIAGEVPIGSIIVLNDKIIARAHNLKEKKNCATKHAEIIAVEKATKKIDNWRLNDAIIYITMFPCPMCASAIQQSRISKIVCGTIPEYANKQLVYDILNDNKYGIPVEIVENILSDKCSDLIKKFFSKKR